ncbi:MAG: signal peptide peptidase SppA [Planctomycetaceae bacterium]
MNTSTPIPAADPQSEVRTIVIQPAGTGSLGRWLARLLALALLISLVFNAGMYFSYRTYFSESLPPYERFHSGNALSSNKVALLEMTGTVMTPFTEQLIASIDRARRDDDVKGAILVIDSPGGLVADSQQIYHALEKLRKTKPVAVVMKRMAASGGYYIAMGAGPEARIYAEPTTWTGSIGVIIPRYNAKVAVDRLGVRSEPLKTGRYKDSLSPFRDLREDEVEVWTAIINDAFDRFLQVIADNRKRLSRRGVPLFGCGAAVNAVAEHRRPSVEHYATGQVFTARQAKRAGLIDEIGYLDQAVDDMKRQLKLADVRVVRYRHPFSLLGMFAGLAKANEPRRQWELLRDLTVPQPMYYCSSLPLIPAPSGDNVSR